MPTGGVAWQGEAERAWLVKADRGDSVVVHVLAIAIEEVRIHLEHAVELKASQVEHSVQPDRRVLASGDRGPSAGLMGRGEPR